VAPISDKEWLLSVQKKLHTRSWQNPDYVFRKLWGYITDLRNLRWSLDRVSRSKGSRSAGVDGVTVKMILAKGPEVYVEELRRALRSGEFRPSPAKRKLIPKAGKPGKFRPLGIPTLTDKVVQTAMKHIMEPIFEADFYPYSYGFRPGKSVHGALEQLRLLMNTSELKRSPEETPRLPYQWAIEGDIKGCFDNISHHGLMNRVRRRIGEGRLNRLIVAFLKAGVMSEGNFLRTPAGTPQGGILSPLLANIALSVIEERYERYVWPRFRPTRRDDEAGIKSRAKANRRYDKEHGRPVLVPVRYADDFIILIGTPNGVNCEEQARELAEKEKVELARLLKDELNLELSESKTLVSPMTKPLRFLGFHFRAQWHPVYGWTAKVSIPKAKSQAFREQIKVVFRRPTINQTLEKRLKELNPIIRGWVYFYRHAMGAKRVFSSLDHYIWHAIYRWLKKKHPRTGFKKLAKRYAHHSIGGTSYYWHEGKTLPFQLASVRVGRYRLGWQPELNFVVTPMESPVHNERCTPGLGKGAPETAG
jgi:group II intron reverse transcriptase/maturase